jgi:hypothetical protein
MLESIAADEIPLRPPAGQSPKDRREWLSLACELDRLRARRMIQEASSGFHVGAVIQKIASIAPIPGRIGKWVRGASIGASVCRAAFRAFTD